MWKVFFIFVVLITNYIMNQPEILTAPKTNVSAHDVGYKPFVSRGLIYLLWDAVN
jgi:hypothetical protein